MLVFKRIMLLILAAISGGMSGAWLIYNNLPVENEERSRLNSCCPVVELLRNNDAGCAEAILWNNSENILKSFYVEIYTQKDILIFETTMVPPFSRVLLQERDRKMAMDMHIQTIDARSDAIAFYQNADDLMTGIASHQGEIAVSNLRNMSMPQLDVYVKPWLEDEGVYTGKTHKISIRNLQAGDSVSAPVPVEQFKIVYIDLNNQK